MKAFSKCSLVIFMLIFAAAGASRAPAAVQESGEGVLVGRISHLEGQLLRYVPEEKDWVATVKDAPFGLEDSLYSDANGKAEFIMPNNTWIRIGGSTQIQLITLRTDVTEADVASGMARFYNRNSQGVIRATSPFGYVVAPANTVFDLYVGDRSLEVIALKGKVDFVLDRDQSRYEVTAGGSSIVSDGQQVTAGQGQVDADWDDWNSQRDQLWSKRTEVRGESVRYLPSSLHDESHALDENGRWEQVYYEGQYRRFWRPTVSAGWAPYTAGRWSVYYGDNCWIPYEPFGYVTHHYGNWVYANSFWYWAPPVVSVQVGVGPFLGIGFGWYPGRVGWLYSGYNIGWVPLAPFEPYYCHRRWGPRNLVINNVNINNININRYSNINRAVFVNQRHLYGVDNYQNVRITNINRNTIIRDYRAAPVVNNTVIHNYNTMRERYNFTNARVENRPHDSVMNRISYNEQAARRGAGTSARAIEQDVSRFSAGKPVPDAKVEAPRVTDRLVRPQDAGRPASDLQLPQRELRSTSRAPSPITAGPGRDMAIQTDQAGRERQTGKGDRGSASTGERRRVGPPTSGDGTTMTGPGVPQTGSEQGQRVRPARPTGEQRAVEQGQMGASPGQTQRVRPPRPGPVQPTTESGQRQPAGDQGPSTQPPKPASESQPVDRGGVQSPLEGSRKVRQPRPQQELQAPQGGQTGSKSPATDQSRRLRSPQPAGSPSQVQSQPATGTAPAGRQQVKPYKGGQDTQSTHPEGGAIQSPGNGSQRSAPSGARRDSRTPATRTVSPSTPGNGNAVLPQAPSQPQRSVAPAPQSAPQQQRMPRHHEPAVQPAEQPAVNGTAVPQTPQIESAPRGGGSGPRGGGSEGQFRGRGRGAGND